MNVLLFAKLIILLLVSTCCSTSTINIDGKIVNGVAATNFIPYQASVRVTIRDQIRFGGGHTCGGVLINRLTVTTAAHCVYDNRQLRNVFDLRVVFGCLRRNLFTSETVIRTVERIVVHPKYRRFESFSHDIALIILRSPIEFSNIIQSIPIINHEVESYTNCQVSGWGATKWQGSMPFELRKANVSIVPRNVCKASYGEVFVNGMICANGIDENGIIDVCQGDSGGPLTCDGKLVGLASFGVECGLSFNFPGVFVDVFYYYDWIIDNWSSATKLRILNLIIIVGMTFHYI